MLATLINFNLLRTKFDRICVGQAGSGEGAGQEGWLAGAGQRHRLPPPRPGVDTAQSGGISK